MKTIKQQMPNGEVKITKDYDKFSFIKENRNINEAHVKKLISSMKVKFLVSPLIINEKHEIIDGQHRFEACRALGFPIYYIKVNNYGFEETKIYNISNRNWKLKDYLDAFVELNNQNYITYKKLWKKYPFPHNILLTIILGKKNAMLDRFKEGNLILTDDIVFTTEAKIKQILDFKEYFSEFKRRSFVYALLTIFQIPDYDHKRMIEKLSYQGAKLLVCTKVDDYLKQLEDIYNYQQQKNKVRFFS